MKVGLAGSTLSYKEQELTLLGAGRNRLDEPRLFSGRR